MKTIKELLKDFTDLDIACYELARTLGAIPWHFSYSADAKAILNSKNPLGEALYNILGKMLSEGVLVKNEENQVKWNDLSKTKD